MTPNRYLVPDPIGKLFALLPAYPGARLAVAGLNQMLAHHLPSDVRQQLNGKTFRIEITDIRLTFDFCWQQGAFVAPRQTGQIDLTLAASAHDFFLLAQRHEDPDTLFFSRRLAMEGDTELGLLVKNTLDAIELPVFDFARYSPKRLLARFQSGRPA